MNKRIIFTILVLISVISQKNFAQEDDFFIPKTTVGGYGELHYNLEKLENLKAKKTLDFHRFVLFIGHSFSEKWSFKSEIELEHNIVEEGQGAVELEQAYVNYQMNDNLGFQAGVILPSVGLINEYHEPPVFFGVERPEYSKVIIPTTWFGNGAAIYGNYGGFDFKLSIMEGLNADKISASSAIRSARQEGFKSNADDLLYSLRIDYLNLKGLKIGTSFTYNNATGDSINNQVILFEFHGKYFYNNLFLVFEYGNISYNQGNLRSSNGFYTDLGYDFSDILNIPTKIIPFIRYTDYNTAASTLTGGSIEEQFHFSKWMAGINIKPMNEVVIKLDYSRAKRNFDDQKTYRFNFGIGYMF